MRDAATWLARMKGPDALAWQSEFELWLGADDLHRMAYSHIAETYSLGKNLNPTKIEFLVQAEEETKARRLRRLAAMVGLAMVVMTPLIYLMRPTTIAERGTAAPPSQFSTRIGEIRSVDLADGSIVTLDTNTYLDVVFGRDRRELWLKKGRARFNVAHDGRTFVVHAGAGTVVAHGTVFDVRVDGARAMVRLIQGAIDVHVPGKVQSEGVIHRALPGQAVAFDDSHGVVAVAPSQETEIVQTTWPDALLDFDGATLGEMAAEANRYSDERLIIADPALATRRVSGTFRVGDPERLADRLAILLDARVGRTPDGDITLNGQSR
ncbi:FecR family protein [Sphingobium sp. TKS]|uniref:FecR family protein n=1 Tax=Sphingobium sp. TKS TaxID=1315974 RepID=UPI00119CE9E2|nr:FecR domain-containing protein [Sphingobium sp. TKS]MCF8707565.1 FecR domain-containing protein [Rhizorhapis sp. SPR117]